MAGNSFCLLLVGLFVIAIAALFASFGTSWGLVDTEYATEPTTQWILVGGLTSTSAIFKIKLPFGDHDDSTSIFSLVVSPDELLVDRRMETTLGLDGSVVSLEVRQGIETLTAGALTPRTRYYYAIEELQTNGETKLAQELQGMFQTPAPEGTRFNFTIATAGCAWTGSRAPLFQEIQKEDPLLFIHLGDFHYEDISSTNMDQRIDAISTVLASNTQSELYRSTSFVNMWDDHDWLGNNANGYPEEKGVRDTALFSYQMAFPHYPLALLEGDATITINTTTTVTTNNSYFIKGSSTTGTEIPKPVPVYHAFTIGTIRFVVSDLRSESNDTFIYSQDQYAWLKEEFRNASAYDFVLWVTTKPWIGTQDANDDSWAGHAQDRLELSEFISNEIGADDGPQNLLALSADAHMVAFDDGFNTYYGPTGDTRIRSFPILQSGALDRFGSTKGETYTGGCHAFELERTHQFSTLKFEFANDGVGKCIQINSYRKIDWANEDLQLIFSTELCGKIFVDAAVSEEEKVGTCEIDDLWVVNDNLNIAAGTMALVVMVLSWTALYNSDASNLGDCCCKSFSVALLVVLSYLITAAVGFGVFFLRGVDQATVAPIFIIVLIQNVLYLFYLIIWWSCCTSPNRRRLDDDDPAFRDVDPNPTFNHDGMDLQYNNNHDSNGDGEEAPGGNSSTNNSAQPY